MIGNLSKSKGFKGDTGEQGPQGVQGIQGVQGEKGDTPVVGFRLDEETGDLYYSSDGVYVDKEYVSSADLVSKEELAEAVDDAKEELNQRIDDVVSDLSRFVISFDGNEGNKTYNQISTAIKNGWEIVFEDSSHYPDIALMEISYFRLTDDRVEFIFNELKSSTRIICKSDNTWIINTADFYEKRQVDNLIKDCEKVANKTTSIDGADDISVCGCGI